MSTKLTYTGAEVQELLDKIEKGDFDNAKTLEGHPASYFAIASEFTSLAESFATEQGRVNTLYSYFNNGSANDALSLGGKLPSYYATATQYEILQRTLSDFKSLFDSMFEKDSEGNIHAKLSLWSSGGITAGGVGSGGSGGGGISYNRLDAWSDYSADKAGYVLSALLGKDLDNRVSALANAGYITASYLAPYALRSEIPSLVGYATESFVTSQGYITASALAPYALRSEIPSLVGYATQSWVGDNYLSKSGGVITGQGDTRHVQLRLDGEMSTVMFQQRGIEKGAVGWWSAIGVRLQNTNAYGLAVTDSNDPIYYWGENGSVQHTLLHSGNYSNLLAGGTINGGMTFASGNLIVSNGHTVVGELYPKNDGSIDLGQGSRKWKDVYLGGYLTWGNSVDSTDLGDWEALKDNIGLRIISSKTSDSGAPYQYATALHVRGRYGFELAVQGGDIDSFAIRSVTNNRGWDRLLHSGNYSSYALSVNGGTVNGSITATSFIGNLVGVADKSKVLGDYYGERVASANLDFTDSAVRKIIATSTMTTSKPPADGSILHFAWDNTGGWNHQLYICSNSLVEPNKRMAWRAQYYGVWGAWQSIAFADSNVASATKLATARSIFGQSFDGTKSITGNEKSIGLDSVNAINGDANSWVDKYSLKLESSNNAMTFMVDNTENSRKAMIQVGHHATAYAGYLGNLYLNPLGGNVAIGGKTADEKLHVHGNGKFTGALTVNSLTIGGVTLTYDSVKEALCINGNMYALGGIAAGGAGISAYTSLEARVARLEQQLNIS